MPTTRERPWSPKDEPAKIDPIAVVMFVVMVMIATAFILTGVVAQSRQSDECWHGMRIGSTDRCVSHRPQH